MCAASGRARGRACLSTRLISSQLITHSHALIWLESAWLSLTDSPYDTLCNTYVLI